MIAMINKRVKILIVIIVAWVIIGILLAFIFTRQGPSVVISNYDDVVSELPQNIRNNINRVMYNAVNDELNDQIKNRNIGAIIREGSYTQSEISEYEAFLSSFIVDIEALRQSFVVNVKWSKNASIVIPGDLLTIDCPTSDQLIYGEFDCKRILGLSEYDDSISQFLPYITSDFRVVAPDIENKILRVYIYKYRYDAELNMVEKRKNMFIDWMASIGLDINNYTVEYIESGW